MHLCDVCHFSCGNAARMRNLCENHWSRSSFQCALPLLSFAADSVAPTCSRYQIMLFGFLQFISCILLKMNVLSAWCAGSVWLLAGSSWTNLLPWCRTLRLSAFVCLLQYLFSTPLNDGVRRPVRDDKIEELDFNLSWTWRLVYLTGVTSRQRCREIRGSLWLQQWN